MLIFGIAEILFGATYAFTFVMAYIAMYHYQRFGLRKDYFGRSFITVFFFVTLLLLILNGMAMLQLRSFEYTTMLQEVWQKLPNKLLP